MIRLAVYIHFISIEKLKYHLDIIEKFDMASGAMPIYFQRHFRTCGRVSALVLLNSY